MKILDKCLNSQTSVKTETCTEINNWLNNRILYNMTPASYILLADEAKNSVWEVTDMFKELTQIKERWLWKLCI